MKQPGGTIWAMILVGFLVSGLSAKVAAEKPKGPTTIVQFYNLLNPDSIKSQKDKWYTGAIVEGDIEVTVDTKNGYLTWSDPGTGGGTLTMEAALFVTADKRKILATNRIDSDSLSVTCELRFYQYKDESMQEIKSGILPDLNVAMFLDEKLDKKSFSKHESLLDRVKIKIELPRFGTAITISPEFTSLGPAITASDLNDEEKEKARQVIEAGLPYTIDLNWDRKKGAFTFGKKAKAGK